MQPWIWARWAAFSRAGFSPGAVAGCCWDWGCYRKTESIHLYGTYLYCVSATRDDGSQMTDEPAGRWHVCRPCRIICRHGQLTWLIRHSITTPLSPHLSLLLLLFAAAAAAAAAAFLMWTKNDLEHELRVQTNKRLAYIQRSAERKISQYRRRVFTCYD